MVITISREYGAAGRAVTRGLAELLGYRLLDEDLPVVVAARLGTSPEHVDGMQYQRAGFGQRLLRSLSVAMPEVELRVDERAKWILPDATAASESDFEHEFLDLIMAVKIVNSLDEAVAHVSRYGTGHSEAIVTEDLARGEEWIRRVDAAAVLVNASTRFIDGGELGLGAEVGISTQKLHARGPMGLRELTCLKWVVRGEGQVR